MTARSPAAEYPTGNICRVGTRRSACGWCTAVRMNPVCGLCRPACCIRRETPLRRSTMCGIRRRNPDKRSWPSRPIRNYPLRRSCRIVWWWVRGFCPASHWCAGQLYFSPGGFVSFNIPKPRSNGQFATELRDRTIDGNTSHDGSCAVFLALTFEVE